MTDEVMDQEVKQRLLSLVDYLGAAAKDAATFTTEQAPLVARDIVAWELWSNASIAAMLIVLATALVVVARVCWANEKKERNSEGGWAFLCFIALATSFTLACFAFFGYTTDAIKAVVAPRVVILEYVQKAVK